MPVKVTLPVLLTLPEKVSVWPGETGCAGHTLVTLMPGVVTSGQVTDAVLVTGAAVQLSLPLAVTVLLTEQPSMDVVKLAVKLTVAPGASVIGPMTGVLGTGWLLPPTPLFRVPLPELRTGPVEGIKPPALADTAGHASVTAMAGAGVTVQVVETVFVTVLNVHMSLPVPLKVVVTAQAALAGTV